MGHIGGGYMTSFDFPGCLAFVLKWEGGYVNNPADPGGATNKGITQTTYNAWRQSQGQPTQSVQAISDVEVQAIYAQNYWHPSGADRVPAALNLAAFDTAVNLGVSRAVRFLEQCVGTTTDGVFGPQTQAAAAACSVSTTAAAYCDAREAYYRALVAQTPSQQVFLKGWLNRLNDLRTTIGLPLPPTSPR